MPNYSEGKIYQVVSPLTNDIYIGCTTLSLKKRMSKHTDLKQLYGEAYIRLIEEYPCKTKEELELRKLHHINNKQQIIEANKSIVYENKIIPSRKTLIYQDDTQYIILNETNKYEVIQKSEPDQKLPDNVVNLTASNLNSAIREYLYDVERKKKAYHKRKEQQKKETAT